MLSTTVDIIATMTDGVPSLLSMDVKPNPSMSGEDYFLRVRGLPFSTTAAEVINFFSGKRAEANKYHKNYGLSIILHFFVTEYNFNNYILL